MRHGERESDIGISRPAAITLHAPTAPLIRSLTLAARNAADRPAAARSQARLLQRLRCRRCPPRGRCARHSVLCAESERRFCADHRLLCRRIHCRPHAQSVRDVQQLAEIRQAVRIRRQRRRRIRRHGALCHGIGAEFGTERGSRQRIDITCHTPLCSAASTPPKINRTSSSASRGSYLPRMMLPVGGYRKPEIRALAHELGLRVADKRDSQEICFVTSGDHADFVRRRAPNATDDNQDTAGEIALADGTVVGRHDGIEGFTIGQRKGLARRDGRAVLRHAHRSRYAARRHRPARRTGPQRT